MTYRVIFAPEAEDQLDEMYLYIADAATEEIANRYVAQVIDYCEGLAVYPIRGLHETTSGRGFARRVSRSEQLSPSPWWMTWCWSSVFSTVAVIMNLPSRFPSNDPRWPSRNGIVKRFWCWVSTMTELHGE